MATRAGNRIITQLHPWTLVIEWTGLLADDDGAWILLSHYNDKSIHVYGDFSGATVTIEGSNEGSNQDVVPTITSAIGLTDPTQTAISMTSAGLKQILENPLYIRPKITDGDGDTEITVRLVCRH